MQCAEESKTAAEYTPQSAAFVPAAAPDAHGLCLLLLSANCCVPVHVPCCCCQVVVAACAGCLLLLRGLAAAAYTPAIRSSDSMPPKLHAPYSFGNMVGCSCIGVFIADGTSASFSTTYESRIEAT